MKKLHIVYGYLPNSWELYSILMFNEPMVFVGNQKYQLTLNVKIYICRKEIELVNIRYGSMISGEFVSNGMTRMPMKLKL